MPTHDHADASIDVGEYGGGLEAPPASLLDCLARLRSDEARGYRAVGADGEIRSASFKVLYETAALAATGLRRSTNSPLRLDGARVVIAAVDPMSFVFCFFSAVMAGLVPVPAPADVSWNARHRTRLRAIVESCRPIAVLADEAGKSSIAELLGDDQAPVLTLDELLAASDGTAELGELRPPTPEDTCFVTYTSGSTYSPKPVILKHRHVLAQLSQTAAAYRESRGSVSVSWVSLFHNMGLVTSVLRPLHSGYTSVLLRPFDFVSRPRVWAEQMSQWAATHTSAPDFGYALCAEHTQDIAGIDLSTLSMARCGGEMVHPETIDAFTRVFEPAGFRAAAFKPSYGLAEATLTVTSCPVDQPPRTLTVSRAWLRKDEVRPAMDLADELSLVSAGIPLADTVVVVADGTGKPVPPNQVGEIWISGPQVAGVDDELATRSGGYRTRDFGFLHEGELVLIGRGSEQFQIRGENFYSGEIEAFLAGTDRSLVAGRVAVFQTDSRRPGTRDLVVLAELKPDVNALGEEMAHLRKRLVRAASEQLGIRISQIEFLTAGTLPVTPSGKLRRLECRDLYEAGSLRTQSGSLTAGPAKGGSD